MPNNWNAIYLGVQAIIDPTEGNTNAENASALVGLTFGGVNDALADDIVFVTTTNVGGSSTALDLNNSIANDTITFNLGSGAQTTVYDASVTYNATLTYIDGTNYSGTFVVMQDTAGNTFLVPEIATGADQTALQADAIRSLTINSINSATGITGLARNRQSTNFVTCFTAGTLIATDRGAVPCEVLRPGDGVLTADRGAQPLRWIGRRHVAGGGALAPVVFARGSIGNDRGLAVSPQHRMLVRGWRAELLFGAEEVLVPALHLVNGRTIRRASCTAVTYIHLMFDRHEIVFAEGAPCESFFPGTEALGRAEAAVRAEILALFPALAGDAAAYGPTARPVLRRAEAAALG
jgi:hypothetical protein